MSDELPVILVVDDNEMNRDLLSRRLKRKGYDVVTVESGEKALEALSQQRFDMIVLDWMMPDMSGIDVLQEIRKTRTPSELPVIMATAKSAPEDMVLGLESGANDYVTKPIDFDVLVARMRVHLRSGRPPAAAAVSAPPAPIGTGSVIDGRYAVGERIGSGGFGSVFRAKHIGLDAPVAIKVLHESLVTNTTLAQRFIREGMSACRVRHPNAVMMLDAGTTSAGVPYLVMELLEGHALDDELEREGLLRLARTAEIAYPMCDALLCAHDAGILHRDVKPGNVFLAKTPRGEQVKVVDFGIATLIESAKSEPVTQGGAIGTPQYMSRERLLGLDCDGRADVYSVGATLYQMLTGELPFGTASNTPFAQAVKQLNSAPVALSSVRPDLPQAVVDVVMHALAELPEQRLSMRELRDAVDRWRTDPWTEPEWPPAVPPRHRMEVAMTALSMSRVVPTADAPTVVNGVAAPEDGERKAGDRAVKRARNQ